MSHLSIGTLARQAGVATGTLRYYERVGLLPAPRRTASGYRSYAPDTARRLRFIRRAQALGFSLEDIAALLALSDDPGAEAAEVRRITREKIGDLEARIRDLERMKRGLETLAAHCSGRGPSGECPILAALNED